MSSQKEHKHMWTVVSHHWQCGICGRTYG